MDKKNVLTTQRDLKCCIVERKENFVNTQSLVAKFVEIRNSASPGSPFEIRTRSCSRVLCTLLNTFTFLCHATRCALVCHSLKTVYMILESRSSFIILYVYVCVCVCTHIYAYICVCIHVSLHLNKSHHNVVLQSILDKYFLNAKLNPFPWLVSIIAELAYTLFVSSTLDIGCCVINHSRTQQLKSGAYVLSHSFCGL